MTDGPKEPAHTDRSLIVGKGYYTKEDGLDSRDVNYFKRNPELLQYVRETPESEMADEALLMVADRCTQGREYDQAIVALNRVMREYPHSAFCAYVFLGFPKPASPGTRLAYRREHMREYPTFSADAAASMLAALHKELGNNDAAILLLETHLKDHPWGRWAVEDYRIQTKLGPPAENFYRVDGAICCQLAGLYADKGDYAKARQILERAIGAHPADSPAAGPFHNLLATIYEKTGSAAKEKESLTTLASLWKQWEAIPIYYIRPFWDPMSNSKSDMSPPAIGSRRPARIKERLEELEGKLRDGKPNAN